MPQATSMTIALSSFFWVAAFILILKCVAGIRGIFVDAGFFLLSVISMFIIFASIVKIRCGTAPFGDVLGAVLPPWIFMVGGVIVLIHLFPGWIQPFSNTFGYMVCLIPGIDSRGKLKAILSEDNPTCKLILEDPTLMLNQFSSSRFNDLMAKLTKEGVVVTDNEKGMKDFRQIVHIKDSVAEFMWHLLVGCVAITTAYNNMMNNVCQKADIVDVAVGDAAAELPPIKV